MRKIVIKDLSLRSKFKFTDKQVLIELTVINHDTGTEYQRLFTPSLKFVAELIKDVDGKVEIIDKDDEIINSDEELKSTLNVAEEVVEITTSDELSATETESDDSETEEGGAV